MVNLILKTTYRYDNGCEGTDYLTYWVDDPRLESILTSGGMSEFAFNRTEVVGAEIVGDKKKEENS